MKDAIRKLYPILLPPLCIIAGVLSIIFFLFGPVGKGQYDILAIGVVAIALAIFQIILILISHFKDKGNKK